MKMKKKSGLLLRDSRYDTGKSDEKSKRLRKIKQLLEKGSRNTYLRGLSSVNPNILVEQLELFILEAKTGMMIDIMKR